MVEDLIAGQARWNEKEVILHEENGVFVSNIHNNMIATDVLFVGR